MTKEVLYFYLGTNGTILSPVHIEDTYYTRRLKLKAADGKSLTKDGGVTTCETVVIPEDDLDLWEEI